MSVFKKLERQTNKAFSKAGGDVQKVFSKRAVSSGLNQMGSGLNEATPYIKTAGEVSGNLAPLVAMTGVGLPVAVGLKAVQGVSKVATMNSQGHGNIFQAGGKMMSPEARANYGYGIQSPVETVRVDKSGNVVNRHSIQAPRPKQKGFDRPVYY